MKRELRKGCTFDGWFEGVIRFPPTYKYEFDSGSYVNDESKSGRRTPAWYVVLLTFRFIQSIILGISTEYTNNNKHAFDLIYTCRCDRILSYGKGIRLLSYKRGELTLSDHRPVTAVYLVEVEVFRRRKLRRALTFTDAEVERYLSSEDDGFRNQKVVEAWDMHEP
jgi:type I inositol polyphosphate 5-phosphatase IP5P1/2